MPKNAKKIVSATYCIKIQDSDEFSAVQKIDVEIPEKVVLPETRDYLYKAIKAKHRPQVELQDLDIKLLDN